MAISRPREWRLRSSVLAALTALTALTARPADAQLPDPYVVPRGALRVSFRPSYTNWDLLFDTDGNQVALGRFFSADTLGAPFLPTLAAAELAVRSITGDGSYRMNAGAFRADQDGDVRRFPFEFSLGLSSRLTLSATIPIVTTRVNSATVLDTAGANVGWNQVTGPAANLGARADVMLLLGDLETAVMTLEAEMAAGSFGCPASTQCDQARAVADRARELAANLTLMTGVAQTSGGDVVFPPFAPLAGSPEGAAILGAISSMNADLQALGQASLTGSLPLPATPTDAGAVNTIITGSEFGYQARTLDPEKSAKLSRFGDIELGLRYALAQGPHMRAVLGARARLPTGFRDLTNDYLDIGPGDRQLDLEWSFDAAFEPGHRLGIWLGASYTLQLGDRLVRRVSPPERPLAEAATELLVDRNLGEILRASVHPLLRLNDQFRIFVSAAYVHKARDRFSANGAPVPELEALTEIETWSFGAGLWYRMESGRRSARLPIEAGISYRSAFSGNGGRAPKANRISMSLRLYYRLWGGMPERETPEAEQQAQERQ